MSVGDSECLMGHGRMAFMVGQGSNCIFFKFYFENESVVVVAAHAEEGCKQKC